MTNTCDHCGKALRERYWFNPFTEPRASLQCDRFLCRLRSGHWLWMNFQRRFTWKWPPFPFRISKKGIDR